MSIDNFWKPEVTVRITVAVIIVLLAAGFIAAYLVFDDPSSRDKIVFIASVIGGAAAVYSAYYAGASLRLNLYRDKQGRAFEVLDSLNRSDTVSAAATIDRAIEAKPGTLTYELITSDLTLYPAVKILLGIYEDLAIAASIGYADEGILYQSVHTTTVYYYDALKQYMDGVRKVKGSKEYYCELEKLVGRWRINKYAYPK